MKIKRTMNLPLVMMLLASSTAFCQTVNNLNNKTQSDMDTTTMNTYVIEREIPGAGKLNGEQLQGVSKTSCAVLKDLGAGIEWVHSYVTDNKIFCIYRAENEAILRTHAERGGFPINSIHKLSTMISPATATAVPEEIIR